MLPHLKAMHAHAARRGDGLRNEFFRHLGRLPVEPALFLEAAAPTGAVRDSRGRLSMAQHPCEKLGAQR